MRTNFLVVMVTVVAMLASVTGRATTAGESSSIVGTWTTVIPDNAGGQRVYLEVRKDGTYTMYSPVYGTAGKFVVTLPDHWSMTATTTTYADQGTFRLPDPEHLQLIGAAGTGIWTRVTQEPYFLEKEVLGQRVPVGLQNFLLNVVTSQRQAWRRDAIPVALHLRAQPPGHEAAYFQIIVSLYSPSAGAGRQVAFSPYVEETQDISVGQLSKDPIAAEFADFPTALEIAHKEGMTGSLKRALMLNFGKSGSVWQIFGSGEMVQVSAAGKALHGDVTGYVDRYNAQWKKAIAGLQARFGAGLPECPVFGHDGYKWGYFHKYVPCEIRTSQALCSMAAPRGARWVNRHCISVMPADCKQFLGCSRWLHP